MSAARTVVAAAERVVEQLVEDEVLDAFAQRLADLREQYAWRAGEEVLPISIAQTRHRLRERDQGIEIGRVVARLNREGIDNYLPRTKPNGCFHTVDPRVSFTYCSTCGGSVIDNYPCHTGGVA